MATPPRTCTNNDCRVAIDGKCVEGLPLDECPHVSQILVEHIDEVEEPEPERARDDIVELSLGEALNRIQTSVLQRRRVSRTVGIIGPNNAGKTSLLASVYDLLQDGPISGVAFAGSSTLIGFEKVCHDARATSRRDTPHMERTSAGSDATFFHLDLRPADSDVVSLFISDRSGEDYLAAADDLARAGEFFELRRADIVTLLVNGEHLASSEHRHEVRAATPQIVDALVEAKSFRAGCRLAIVMTKQDSVLSSAHADRAHREFDELVDGIVHSHSDYFGGIDRFIVAASPRDCTKVKRGDGVDRLLLFWLSVASFPAADAPTACESTRMIDLLRISGEVVE